MESNDLSDAERAQLQNKASRIEKEQSYHREKKRQNTRLLADIKNTVVEIFGKKVKTPKDIPTRKQVYRVLQTKFEIEKFAPMPDTEQAKTLRKFVNEIIDAKTAAIQKRLERGSKRTAEGKIVGQGTAGSKEPVESEDLMSKDDVNPEVREDTQELKQITEIAQSTAEIVVVELDLKGTQTNQARASTEITLSSSETISKV